MFFHHYEQQIKKHIIIITFYILKSTLIKYRTFWNFRKCRQKNKNKKSWLFDCEK